MVANVCDEARQITLELSGITTPICVRITDENHTDEKILTLASRGDMILTIPMAPQGFAYVGTDLPDPVAPMVSL
jgi:hypothetical protein